VLRVTEASGAAISTNTGNTAYAAYGGFRTIGGTAAIAGDNGKLQAAGPRIGRAVITCNAGGDAAFTNLCPALAGYYGVLKIKSIITSIASAAATCSLTWQSPAATAALPNIQVMPVPLAANVMYSTVGPLTVTHAALTDNAEIGVVLTDFGVPSAATVIIEYEYWYET